MLTLESEKGDPSFVSDIKTNNQTDLFRTEDAVTRLLREMKETRENMNKLQQRIEELEWNTGVKKYIERS